MSDEQAGHGELVERLRAIKTAADNLLAPVAAETCHLWHDAPDVDVMPYLVAAKTALPGRLFAALYDLTGDDLREAAAALAAQDAEIARLTRERDEALTAERERCAKIAEEHPWPTQTTEALWPIERTVIAAAIRGGSDASD